MPSYISVDELKEIAKDYSIIIKIDIERHSEAALTEFCRAATLILDTTFDFKGEKADLKQETEFPRKDAPDLSIPRNIKLATAYIASFVAKGDISTIVDTQLQTNVHREKIDVLEIEYFDRTANQGAVRKSFTEHPYLYNLIRSFLSNEFLKGQTQRPINIPLGRA